MKKTSRDRRKQAAQEVSRSPSPLIDTLKFCTKNHNFHRLLLCFLSIGPFLPSLRGDFVFDDTETILNNPVVNGKEPLSNIFTRDFWGRTIASDASHKSYRPVTTFTFWLNYALHETCTTGYHVVNLLLHACCTLTLHNVMQKLSWLSESTDEATSFLAAAIFALHPIHTEAVANMTGRAELLMSLFLFIAIRFYLSKNYLSFFIFSSLSIFSKEQGIMIFPICILVDVLSEKFSWKRIGILLIAMLDFIFLRLAINGYKTVKFTALDNPAAFIEYPLYRWLNIAYLWLYHAKLLVLPYPLCFDYSMGCIQLIKSLTDQRILLLLSVPIVSVALLFNLYRILQEKDKRNLLFAILFGSLAMFPASNIVFTVGFTVAERVLYLPSAGYCIVLALIYKYLSRIYKSTEIIGVGIMALAFSQCYKRSHEWTNELALYRSGLEVCPLNAKIHYNLGKVLNDRGEEEEAAKNYWNAIDLYPTYDQALNNLGNLLERNGRRSQAELLLKRALQAKPHFAGAWMNLGITQMNMGKYSDAEAAFRRSLRLRPNSADCYFNLGNLYQKTGTSYKAMDAWKNATRIDPTHAKSWINLLVVLDELNECQAAIELSHEVLAQLPYESTVLFQLGSCYGQLGHYEKAEMMLKEAIELQPNNSMYHTNLGVLYERWQRFSEAEKCYHRAASLEEQSRFPAALANDNVNSLKRRKGFRRNSTKHH